MRNARDGQNKLKTRTFVGYVRCCRRRARESASKYVQKNTLSPLGDPSRSVRLAVYLEKKKTQRKYVCERSNRRVRHFEFYEFPSSVFLVFWGFSLFRKRSLLRAVSAERPNTILVTRRRNPSFGRRLTRSISFLPKTSWLRRRAAHAINVSCCRGP